LLIVSNRLPATLATSGDGASWKPSSGGLATGLRSVADKLNTVWIGWPGNLAAIDEATATPLLDQLTSDRTIPVRLTRREIDIFYEDISNGVLWPIFHDRLDQPPLHPQGWDVYEAINTRFADAVAAVWRPGDIVWIHDYHLLRLPALVRERIPDATIGFFLHIPFPNPEIFFALPNREHLVEGLLGADVIGFHTRRYRGHFTAALRRLRGLEMDADAHVGYRGRRIALGVFPMGIDAAGFAERSTSRAVSRAVLDMRRGAPQERIILGVDRLDYSKGIPRRLLSFQRLLERHPEWHGRVRLLQLAVPSRGGLRAYRRLRREIERLVSHINGEFSTPSWTPIRYMHRSVDDERLLSLYKSADLMLVTPLRDGMNLVAKEFVACRSDEDGVLILSEFAGAADQLVDAVIVNPYDIDGVAAAMHGALSMEGGERRRRMRRLREHVLHFDVDHWVADCITALSGVRS
jgi:trehalose 6-phosphate synthase/phosphatase